jgi:hypothetical protein
MESDDLLGSRNAWSRTPLVGRAQVKINQATLLEEERTSLVGPIDFECKRAGLTDQS